MSSFSNPEPQPLEWRAAPSLRHRLWRAVSAPVAASVVVFVAVVLIAIATVWLQPHGAENGAFEAGGTGGAAPLRSNASATGEGRGSERDAAIMVHVVGEVLRPGLVELPAGSRLSAALQAAGGPTEAAQLAGVNLARVLRDGEQILVPSAEQLQASSGGADGAQGVRGRGLVNLNTADAAALETLPKIGPALAQRIVQWRGRNGGFASVEQLLDVSGIGPKVFEDLRELVTV